jgi:hypothetical protein
MEETAAQPQVQSRTSAYRNPLRYTNFYPLYDGANDQVDPVLRVQPVLFQRVLPRYRLSSSDTRDLGVGPMFTEIPAATFRRNPDIGSSEQAGGGRGTDGVPVARPRGVVQPLEPWKGTRVDLFA